MSGRAGQRTVRRPVRQEESGCTQATYFLAMIQTAWMIPGMYPSNVSRMFRMTAKSDFQKYAKWRQQNGSDKS
jgi:hypothetical protein